MAALRILLALQDPKVRQILERFLADEEGVHVLPVEADPFGDLEEEIRAHRPDVLILEVVLQREELFPLLEGLLGRFPTLSILLVGPRPTEVDLRHAMRIGVRGYLVVPLVLDELQDALRTIRAQWEGLPLPDLEEKVPQAHRITVLGAKGGVGTTTLTVNLAIWLTTRYKQRVLLFDGDLVNGDACIQLNVHPHRLLVDLIPRHQELDAELVHQILTPHPSGLQVLCAPGPQYLTWAEGLIPGQLNQVLDAVAADFDFLLIDGGRWSTLSRALFLTADVTFLVTTPEIGPLRNLHYLLTLAREQGRADWETHVVLNRANSKVGLRLRDIERQLGTKPDFLLESCGERLVFSVNAGVPLVLREPEGIFSQEVDRMARLLLALRGGKTAA